MIFLPYNLSRNNDRWKSLNYLRDKCDFTHNSFVLKATNEFLMLKTAAVLTYFY